MSAAPEYRYTLDPAYFRDTEEHMVALQPPWKRRIVRSLPVAIFVVLVLVLVWAFHDRPGTLILSLGAAGLFYWRELIKVRKRRRAGWTGTPLEDAQVRVALTSEGLDVETESVRARSNWSLITQARAFDNGILLREGTNMYRWLPDSALSGASPSEVVELVHTKVVDFARVP